jgi:3-hydroxyisobutyrate dehydrogenase-like beta-hydroxyacid dehydrogenase
LGKIAIHVGEPGVASSAKLAINYLLGLNLQGIAETVLFAEKNGVSKEDAQHHQSRRLWQRNYEYQNTFYSQRFFPACI